MNQIVEKVVFSAPEMYSNLSRRDFALRQHLEKLRKNLLPQEREKLSRELISTIESIWPDITKIKDKTLLKKILTETEDKAMTLVLKGADLAYYKSVQDLKKQASILDITYDQTFPRLNKLLLRAGADYYSYGLGDLERDCNFNDMIRTKLYHIDMKFRGKTTLMRAAEQISYKNVHRACELGANPFYRDNKLRFTAREWAQYKLRDMRLPYDSYELRKIIFYLRNYETKWVKQNKFIPDEYENKKIYSEIPFIPNRELKPEDIGKATYIAYTISKEQKDENENSEAKI